jgi:hypothetical protein
VCAGDQNQILMHVLPLSYTPASDNPIISGKGPRVLEWAKGHTQKMTLSISHPGSAQR